METIKGDFIGFTIGDFHSSQLGILRTSNGDRFDEDLLPAFSDSTAQVPGGNGSYYWRSLFSERNFSIPIAYDSMTEKQFRTLRRVMSSKDIIPLVFDERPYKEYLVKPTGTPQLNFICFDEKDARVYKGEGTLEFTAYYPFARNRHIKGHGLKYLNEFKTNGEYSLPEWSGFMSNRDEWSESSGMLMEQGDYDKTVKFDTEAPKYGIRLYNAGDLETDFKLFIKLKDGVFPVKTLCLQDDPKAIAPIKLGKIMNFQESEANRTITNETEKANNKFVCIDVKTNLLLGYTGETVSGVLQPGVPTGKIYNKFIASGDFFTISTSAEYDTMYLGVYTDTAINPINKLEYNYLYY